MTEKYGQPARLRYPVRLGSKENGELFPAGTEVLVLNPRNKLVQKVFKNIQYVEGSTQVAVQFPNRNHVTILDESQIVVDGTCNHKDLNISPMGIYCDTCGEEFEDNTGSNEMGG